MIECPHSPFFVRRYCQTPHQAERKIFTLAPNSFVESENLVRLGFVGDSNTSTILEHNKSLYREKYDEFTYICNEKSLV
jgi:hypothetical protein